MDNELSELSKPVAWISESNLRNLRKGVNAVYVKNAPIWAKPVALYSQEYVSALIHRAERLDSMLTESVQALKAAEQRIAELEASLATPVRLPDIRQSSSGDRYQWSDGVHNYRLDVISMLLGAGFTVAVEGVE